MRTFLAIVSRLEPLLNSASTYTVLAYIKQTMRSVMGPLALTRGLVAGLGKGNSVIFGQKIAAPSCA